MKRTNKKLLTLMLAGVLCAATAGTVAAALPVNASADTTAKSYELTKVFNSNGTSSTIAGKDGKTALTMGDGNSVEFNRNLAINWFALNAENAVEEKFTTLKFTFDDLKFTEMNFVFDALALHAAKDDIAVNTVKFINDGTTVSVKVLNGAQKSDDVEALPTAITAENKSFTLSLAEGSELGCYAVNLTIGEETAKIGEFTNIGAKYFSNSTVNGNELQALVVEAKAPANEKTVLIVDEINGQKFDNISSDNKVADTAAPVLVVNEDIRGFLLGSQFELDYKEIDVLDESLTTKKTFYQYNPTHEKVAYAENNIDYATTITPNSTTGTYFMDTVVYYNGTDFSKEAAEGYNKTTLYRALGEEYVSIRFTVEDDTYTGTGEDTHTKAYYDLAWYAEADAVANKTVGTEEKSYIILNRNEIGPKYNAYKTEDITNYEARLQKNADKNTAEVELPSLAWLINDETSGYQTLQYTISYKIPGDSSAKTTANVDPKGLKISVTEAGLYEFKVLASDVAGNAMYVDKLDENGDVVMTKKLDENGNVVVDGNGNPVMVPEQVKVTTSNIWDLDNVPSFKFSVAVKGLEIEDGEDTDTLETKILGESFTMPTIDLVGTTDADKTYALYKLDLSKYDGAGSLTVDTLSKIKFAALQTEASALRAAELSGDFIVLDHQAINKQAYINLIAKALGGDVEAEKAAVAKIFTEIEAFNGRIDKEENEEAWNDSDNKYNWNATAGSFDAVESGLFLIVADFWDEELRVDHAPAYQLVEVESEADVIKGETEWLKKNLVSVILFSVAAVLLILIIILLLVKPSDETLEDVDEKIISKRKEATDKHKNK